MTKNNTSKEDRLLLERAERVAAKAYAPYSQFRVGAVVVLPDGSIFEGCNVENAAYGASVCAEVNAITTAATNGATKIEAVAVICLDEAPCPPCGGCRQVMREFSVERIVMRDKEGLPVVFTLSDLLPMSFGPEALE